VSRQRKKRCYCQAELLDDGTCRYGCSPYANPAYLRAQAKRRRLNDERPTRIALTDDEKSRASDAVAKIDPVYGKQRRMLFGAAMKSHRAGARR
jgi:hypothetical protein